MKRVERFLFDAVYLAARVIVSFSIYVAAVWGLSSFYLAGVNLFEASSANHGAFTIGIFAMSIVLAASSQIRSGQIEKNRQSIGIVIALSNVYYFVAFVGGSLGLAWILLQPLAEYGPLRGVGFEGVAGIGLVVGFLIWGCWLYLGRRVNASRLEDRGLCGACGYDLAGIEPGRCPECGKRYA